MWIYLFIHKNHKSNHKSLGLHTYNNLICEWLQLINKEAQTADWFYLFLKQNKQKTHILQATRNRPVYPGNWNWEKAGTALLSYKVGFTSKLVRHGFFCLFILFFLNDCMLIKWTIHHKDVMPINIFTANIEALNFTEQTWKGTICQTGLRDGGWFVQCPLSSLDTSFKLKVNTESLRVILLGWSNWASW